MLDAERLAERLEPYKERLLQEAESCLKEIQSLDTNDYYAWTCKAKVIAYNSSTIMCTLLEVSEKYARLVKQTVVP